MGQKVENGIKYEFLRVSKRANNILMHYYIARRRNKAHYIIKISIDEHLTWNDHVELLKIS